MTHVYPDYYYDFKCIAEKCTHNCCIGWEIDIDPDTEKKYKADKSALDFLQHIDFTASPSHFILGEDERCPYLNCRNLCDIITCKGEEHLCTICREHPRFHCELPDRIESGIGMCCEEAARIILTNTSAVSLISDSDLITDDEIILLRDRIIQVLQNRSKPISHRIGDMLGLCDTPTENPKSIPQWADFLLSLEILSNDWTHTLCTLIKYYPVTDFAAFDEHMYSRQHEYEQLLVYIIYRHFATAPNISEARLRAQFAALCYHIIYSIGAALYTKDKEFTISTQIELCRMLSSEIEYSDENLDKIYDELYFGE